MIGLGKKYLALVAVVITMFVNFVACGAQMYRQSLEGDTELKNVEGSDDPKSANFGLHSPGGWTKLPIRFKVSKALTPEQQAGLLGAMRIWEIAVGKKLFTFEGTQDATGDSFKDLYSSLNDDVNGHYLDDNWKKTKKEPRVLATTIWNNSAQNTAQIDTADIRFNSNYYLMGNAFTTEAVDSREIVDMETLALHELGHLLGLMHVSQVYDSGSIMNPAVYIGQGLANRRLSKGDVQRVQKIYGCVGGADACNAEKIIAKVDAMQQESRDAVDDGYKKDPTVETDTAH